MYHNIKRSVRKIGLELDEAGITIKDQRTGKTVSWKIYYPTKEYILRLHNFLIEEFRLDEDPISEGIYSDGVLEFLGVKRYQKPKNNHKDDILLRGAHMFNKFLKEGHPFVDGNKRTGLFTLWLFLLVNGVGLKSSFFQKEKHVEKIKVWADSHKTPDNVIIEEIYRWIQHNVE